ncbi:MAG: HDOD domain-containing protein [Actinomycetia bacterium]|nr:HDOD domain-containing protein [Actinomycetes bacterium]
MIIELGTDKTPQLRLQDLPVLPSVITRLMSLDRHSRSYSEDVEALISVDPGFAAQVLAAANSAASAPASPICAIPSALARIGSTFAVDQLMARGISRVFVPRDDRERALWQHSIQVALAAKEIETRTGASGHDPDETYVAGLLHDIGRFVMFQEAPEVFRAIDETDWDVPASLVEMERDRFGLDHAELGALACRTSSVPSTLTEVVRFHHEPQASPAGRMARLTSVIHLADLAMFPSTTAQRPDHPGVYETSVERGLLQAIPSWMKLTSEQLREITAGATEEAAMLCSELGI